MKKLLSAWIVGFLTMYVISIIWYGVIIDNYNSVQFANVLRGADSFSMLNITIGYLLLTLFMAYIYPYGYKGGKYIVEGLRFGLILGLFWALPAAFINSGAYKFPLTAALVDAIYHIVEITIGGAVIGHMRKDL